MDRRRRPRGFTLLEVLLVLGLVGLASVLAVASMSGSFDGMRLRGAVEEIATQLRFTRTVAIATGEPQRFTITPSTHRWTAPKGREGILPRELSLLFYGAREVQPAAGEGAIVFFPDGASTGGRLQLQLQEAAWQVEVAWMTGEVSTTTAAAR